MRIFPFALLAPVSVIAPPTIQIPTSPISIPIVASINTTVTGKTLPQVDREWVRNGGVGAPIRNAAVIYVASVGIGSPPTTYKLRVDTGSSNTWIGAGREYQPTSTSHKTINKVNVTYGFEHFSGMEYTDRVTLSPRLVIKEQSIGVSSESVGFNGLELDGVLGLGPTDLTVGTLKPAQKQSIPTITDNMVHQNLFKQGIITSNEVGISFEPATVLSATNGQLTFGGTDFTKYTGNITYVPVTTTRPASASWGIDMSVRYSTNNTIFSKKSGIVDTGTALILLPTPAFHAYASASGGVFDDRTGMLKLTNIQFEMLKSLFFTIGGTTFELTPNAQIWPRAFNSRFGGEQGSVYLIVGDMGPGRGLGFVCGFTFLERFYTVYDTQRRRMGFAETLFTYAEVN